MGPRSIDRGIAAACSARFTRLSLQWGRDQLIAELTPPRSLSLAAGRLQWGRDQLIAEFLPHDSQGRASVKLQWGRDQLIAELNPRG